MTPIGRFSKEMQSRWHLTDNIKSGHKGDDNYVTTFTLT